MLLAIFYAILIFGSVWMTYPFLLMLSGSIRSEVDSRQSGIVPRFLFDEEMLFRKFEEQRYGRIDLALAATHATNQEGGRVYSFESFPVPGFINEPRQRDWRAFLHQGRNALPDSFFAMGHVYGLRTIPEISFQYMKELRRRFPDISASEFKFSILPEEWNVRSYRPPSPPRAEVYFALRRSLPERYFYPISLDGAFAAKAAARYGEGVEGLQRLNQEWGTEYRSFQEITLPPGLPENPAERALWVDFVRHALSTRFLKFGADLAPPYQTFLKARYGSLAELNRSYGSHYTNWAEVSFPEGEAPVLALSDSASFLQGLTDFSAISLRSADTEWRDHLRRAYAGDITALNRAWSNTSYQSFEQIGLPVLEYDLTILREYKRAILWDLLTRNYRIAWDQVVSSGHGLRNTMIFCLLNVLVALIINPLAAYALSRFQPAWGSMVLFLLMATMAFPAEVTQIPSFLLLRDLGWLNTFAALVIPAAANGYSIFLLKGFFDSLPKELYEAATIDGSGELRTFFSITLPLSGPILAVIALGAFTAAYGAFMFALLVCQKESMWTVMVYIYQLQQSYDPPIVFAALVIAALPTLAVFILCQNVIMRGIVVPVEK